MTRIGLELNASFVRGVLGPAGDYPPPLPLEPPGHELPMVFLLEKSTPELGRVAVSVARALLVSGCSCPVRRSRPRHASAWSSLRASSPEIPHAVPSWLRVTAPWVWMISSATLVGLQTSPRNR